MSAELSSILPGGTWLVDDEMSLVEFELHCLFGIRLHGTFGSFVGAVRSDEGAALTIESDSLCARHPWLARRLRACLETAAHPRLTLETAFAERVGPGLVRLLTVVGVQGRTERVELSLRPGCSAVADETGRVHFLAQGTLSRETLGLRRRRFALVRQAAVSLSLTAYRAGRAQAA